MQQRMVNLTKHPIVIAGVAAVVICTIFALGVTLGHNDVARTTPPAATPALATSTPRVELLTPRVLGALLPAFGTPCETCWTLTFTARGPFDMIAECQPTGMFADALPTYQLGLYNGNGHLVDSLKLPCGDPNSATVTTRSIPENLGAGSYRLEVSASGSQPVSVLILDATP